MCYNIIQGGRLRKGSFKFVTTKAPAPGESVGTRALSVGVFSCYLRKIEKFGLNVKRKLPDLKPLKTGIYKVFNPFKIDDNTCSISTCFGGSIFADEPTEDSLRQFLFV